MDKIHEGWLVKSPPDWKKHLTLFKLKKWRRRYFVLYSPPLSCIIPGTCDAQLCYYENETLSRECGRIDLKNCEEIISQLETDDFKHVMALETVFRNQTRIYYLAADSEEDLDTWVEKISYVLSISGDEFVEVNRKETKVKSKKSNSKTDSSGSKPEKPRYKTTGISLRRSSSTLSKSTTNINLLNRTIMVATSRSPTPTLGKFSKQPSCDTPSLTFTPDLGESETTFGKTSIRSKPSFLNKIKQLKPNSRRPSCPIIIPTQSSTEESPSTPSNFLRPNASNPSRFQGSSGSSVISFASDYKTPDVTSPIMPPLFYQAVKKYEMNECAFRLENKFSPFSEPPPLPPKTRSSDSGLPDENITPNVNPIYDVPAHKYGSYGEEGDAEYMMDDRSEELEGVTRFDGVCLSVVDEREDEGLENDLNLDEYREEILESIPPPLPERRRPCVEKTYRNSSDSEYDILPFSLVLRTNLSADDKILSKDSDDNHDSLSLEMIASKDEDAFDQTPPPLPVRNKKLFDEAIFGKFMTDQSSSTSESNDNIYDFVINNKSSVNDLCSINAHCKDDVSNFCNLEIFSQIQQSSFSVKNRPLMRMKSKSLENTLLPIDDSLKEFPHRTSTGENDDKIIRETFKTRSFKRKSIDCKNELDASASSMESTGSPFSDIQKPFVVHDHDLY